MTTTRPILRGQCFSLARVTIELLTPLTIGTGGGADTRDTLCVEDANGLPTIPGTSIAGVLRHALEGGKDPAKDPICKLFGFQGKDDQGKDDGQSSQVEVSWAQVHDSHDQPAPMRGIDIQGDPVLAFLAAGVVRDHVRIDHRGGADGDGKFDESLVPAGARFTFEILVHEGGGVQDSMELLHDILNRLPDLRLGGRTRRGFGALRVIRIAERRFDLRQAEGRKEWQRLPRALHQPVPAGLLVGWEATKRRDKLRLTLRLRPKDYFLFGGGRAERDEHFRRDKGQPSDREHDRLPFTEKRVTWIALGTGERGEVTDEPAHVLPASGIKGALRHRVAFHARRLREAWAEPAWASWADKTGYTEEEEWLFGKVKEAVGTDRSDTTGRVLLSDVWLSSFRYGALQHVSLDRFTQGPMDGLLFSEAPLYGGPELLVQLDIVAVSAQPGPDKDLQRRARAALAAALADLCEGRLALGSGSSRGHGYFEGDQDWSDKGSWIGGRP